MSQQEWRERIEEQMKSCGVYNESFADSVEALAGILEQRDQTRQEFVDSGGRSVVEHTLDRGAVNMKINPLLKTWMDLNAQALTYWNSLGLTPRGYKQMTGSLNVKVESRSLEEALSELGI